MTLKSDLVKWWVKSPDAWTSLLDGSTVGFVPTPTTPITLWGAYVEREGTENYQQSFARFDTNCGATTQVIRLYDQNKPQNGNGPNEVLTYAQTSGLGFGTIPMCLSFKLYSDSIIAGTYDSMLISFAETIAAVATASCPMYWCYWHEIDVAIAQNQTNLGDMTAAKFIAGWQYIHTLIAPYINAHVKAIHILGGTSYSTRLSTYYPGNAYVDVCGIDPYTNSGSPVSFQTLTQASYDQVLALGGPTFAITETGIKSGSSAQWLTFIESMLWADGKFEFVTVFDDAGFNTQFDNIPAAASYYGELMDHTA